MFTCLPPYTYTHKVSQLLISYRQRDYRIVGEGTMQVHKKIIYKQNKGWPDCLHHPSLFQGAFKSGLGGGGGGGLAFFLFCMYNVIIIMCIWNLFTFYPMPSTKTTHFSLECQHIGTESINMHVCMYDYNNYEIMYPVCICSYLLPVLEIQRKSNDYMLRD